MTDKLHNKKFRYNVVLLYLKKAPCTVSKRLLSQMGLKMISSGEKNLYSHLQVISRCWLMVVCISVGAAVTVLENDDCLRQP